MKKYQTKQRTQLLDFFKTNLHSQFSARQIADYFSGGGISLSSVYRNLSQMENEGILKRTFQKNSKEPLFQYLDPLQCSGYLHLVCSGCGLTSHMDNIIADNLSQSLKSNNGFMVNLHHATLYGMCENCSTIDA